MIIVNNSANFSGMPAFGGINHARNLIFGLRSNSPSNAVNLSDMADKAVITDSNVDYVNDGIKGGLNKKINTNLVVTSDEVTIKAVISVDMPSFGNIGIFGDLNANNGMGLILAPAPTANGHDYNFRFYVSSNGSSIPKAQQTAAQNTTLNHTNKLNIWCKLDAKKDKIAIKIGDNAWTEVIDANANFSNRNDANWWFGALPRFDTVADGSVVISEILVWNKLFSDLDIARQNDLSSKWLSTIA